MGSRWSCFLARLRPTQLIHTPHFPGHPIPHRPLTQLAHLFALFLDRFPLNPLFILTRQDRADTSKITRYISALILMILFYEPFRCLGLLAPQPGVTNHLPSLRTLYFTISARSPSNRP